MKRHRRRFETDRLYRPLGPADCFKTRFAGKCTKCDAYSTRLHVPTRLVLGKFCEGCCPVCHPAGAQPGERPTEQPKSTQ